MDKTILKKLTIRRFRALKNIEIEFGTQITVICGKNGTSKSSILGIAAQIFSFDKNYKTNTSLSYRTITNSSYKSLPKEHFRFSETYDIPGSLDVAVELYDAYTSQDATAELELSRRKSKGSKWTARPVVRKNSTAKNNRSRNFTHPVIFLGLERLLPIAARDYNVTDFDYLNRHKRHFIDLNNELLNKESSTATGTSGSISSAVAHADNYDQDSVSAGEDNAGQIILALMSFIKLQTEYPDYKGGLLLIDEADAGLFPAAQTKLIDILAREAHQLNLQVVMTSHSPTLIEHVYDLSQRYQKRFKTIYLSDTYGDIQAMTDMNWEQIRADLLTTTVPVVDSRLAPKLNVYFEDREGYELFKMIMTRQRVNRFLNPLPKISMGCPNYIQLTRNGVAEFAEKSLIVLDADAKGTQRYQTIILLPGNLPPDQLIFEFLYNLPKTDPIWKNSIQYTRVNFTNDIRLITQRLDLNNPSVNLKNTIAAYRINPNDNKQKKIRELFKEFYNSPEFSDFLQLTGENNPWKRWMNENQEICQEFRDLVKIRVCKIMQSGYRIDSSTSAIIKNL